MATFAISHAAVTQIIDARFNGNVLVTNLGPDTVYITDDPAGDATNSTPLLLNQQLNLPRFSSGQQVLATCASGKTADVRVTFVG